MRVLLFTLVLIALIAIASAAAKSPSPKPKPSVKPSDFKILPIPPQALGPAPNVKTASGQMIVVQEIVAGTGVFWVYDGVGYHNMFMVSDMGVIVVDCPGLYVLDAIKSVTSTPVTHYIYSHTHKDHNNCGAVFPNATYIGHVASTEHLAILQDTARPIPTISFADKYNIKLGKTKIQNVQLESSTSHAPNHLMGNIFISVPAASVLMFADVVFPGWVPFINFGVAQDLQTYYTVHSKILTFNFTKYIGGHVSRMGVRQDVIDSANYFDSVVKISQDVLKEGSDSGSFAKTLLTTLQKIPNNSWAAIFAAYSQEAFICATRVTDLWKGKLAGVDVFSPGHCDTMLEYLRLN